MMRTVMTRAVGWAGALALGLLGWLEWQEKRLRIFAEMGDEE